MSAVTLRFQGYSDDTAGCYWTATDGHRNDVDNDDCAAGSTRVFHVFDGAAEMAVTMQYGLASCWVVGIGPLNDDVPMPPWPMRWSFERYSAILEIDVPVGAHVGLVEFGAEDRMVHKTPSQTTRVS